jgi:hypothetical protein
METNAPGSTRRITSGRLALVCAILALVVSLGAPSEAAKLINGKLLKNDSVAGKKLKNSTIAGAKIKADALTGAKVKADTLTGSDINESTLTGVLKTGDVAVYGVGKDEPFASPPQAAFAPVLSKAFTAPTNGVLYITGTIGGVDDTTVGGVGRLLYRLRLDETPLTSYVAAHGLSFVSTYDSGAVTGVVPVTKGAHTVHLETRENGSGSYIHGREISVLFVPNR